MRAGWICAILTGCAEPAIDLQLELPSDDVAAFDMSCLAAVDVMGFSQSMLDEGPADIGAHAVDHHERSSCVDVAHVTSFTDLANQLRGTIDVAIPPGGLAALEVRGRASSCEVTPYDQAIVYGGGQYLTGASFVSVLVAANINCRTATSTKVQPIDMLGLIADPMHACKLLANTGNRDATYPAVIRPSGMTSLPSGPDATLFERAKLHSLGLGLDGTSTLRTYGASALDACIAVARESEQFVGASCVNAGTPSLCATDASTVELPVVTAGLVSPAYDPALIRQFGLPVLGFVWAVTGTAKTPLAGATVTADDPSRAKVVYMDVVNGNVMAAAAGTAATRATGVFFVYTNGITTITVRATGHAKQRLTIGPATTDLQGTVLAVLQ